MARWARPPFVAALLIVVCTGVPASPRGQPTERFRLIADEEPERLERRLQSAAAEGYRLVASAQGISVSGHPRIATLLERPSEGSTPLEYVVVTCPGNLNEETTRARVNALGARGYRLTAQGVVVRRITDFYLPESAYEEQMVLILERAAPASYAYESLAFGDFGPFYDRLEDRRGEGYEILGLWNSGRRLQVILENQEDRAPAVASAGADFRLLIMATRTVARTKLRSAAKQGFRVLAADDPSTPGPPLLLLRKVAVAEDPVRYRFLGDVPKKLRKDKLERKLNKKARQGWRLTAGGVTANVLTLERVSEDPPQATYLAVSSNKPPGLPRALEAATHRGYRFAAMFVEPAETTVLLQKPAD